MATTTIFFIYPSSSFSQNSWPIACHPRFLPPSTPPFFFQNPDPTNILVLAALTQCLPEIAATHIGFIYPSSRVSQNPWPVPYHPRFLPNPNFFVKSRPNQDFSLVAFSMNSQLIATTTIFFIYPSSSFSPNPWPIRPTQSFYPPQWQFFFFAKSNP